MITKMEYPTVIAVVGGEGTRMYPLTLEQTKPLVPICNYATMRRMYEILAKQGCRDFIFASCGAGNTTQLKSYLKWGEGFSARLGLEPRATFRYQPNYDDKGSADAVRACMEYYNIKNDVLVIGGDNIMDINLEEIMKFHRDKDALMTIGLTEVDNVSNYGVADMDEKGRILQFVEKPKKGEEPSNLANVGIYVLSPRIRELFKGMPVDAVRDFGYDLIPFLTRKLYSVYGYIHDGYWNDVGTPGRYLKTTLDMLRGEVKHIVFKDINSYTDTVWIHPDTMKRIKNKLAEGKIQFGDHVLIGGDCEIGNNVKIENACIGDVCIIGDNVEIKKSVVMDFANIHENAKLNKCIIGRYATIGHNSIIDADINIDVGGACDRTPVIGENVTIVENSVIGPKKRVSPLNESHRIMRTGKFTELGFDSKNFYFIEK
ncbi:hypothetical protein BEH94_01045 [Candidatus Altiarchaeales archaeon WOR_SM1_SCG]|nr:hypothetical protein BEH94_01045 [Candidatus Altiarchaeales archaeon WOR_SM1_SCG]